jgi:hypothetical protein
MVDTIMEDPKRILLIGISVGLQHIHNCELIRKWHIERIPQFNSIQAKFPLPQGGFYAISWREQCYS